MSTKILIDGDVLVFAIAAAIEENFDWGDDYWSCSCDLKQASQVADVRISEWRSILKGDSVLIAFSDPKHNWRKDVLPSYKSNRKGRKPVGFGALRDYLMECYPSKMIPSLEADDILGIEATKRVVQKRIVVSIDKDLKSVPGLLWNPDHPELGIQEITKAQADYNHLFQALTGDTSDGYRGCPGVGPKTADRALSKAKNQWKEVVNLYEEAGLSEPVALEQARVARILRSGEYNEKKKEVILWTPTS